MTLRQVLLKSKGWGKPDIFFLQPYGTRLEVSRVPVCLWFGYYYRNIYGDWGATCGHTYQKVKETIVIYIFTYVRRAVL